MVSTRRVHLENLMALAQTILCKRSSKMRKLMFASAATMALALAPMTASFAAEANGIVGGFGGVSGGTSADTSARNGGMALSGAQTGSFSSLSVNPKGAVNANGGSTTVTGVATHGKAFGDASGGSTYQNGGGFIASVPGTKNHGKGNPHN
jgi:hypothetical protein